MVGSKLTPRRLDNYGLVSKNWFPPTPSSGVFFRKSNAKAAKSVTCLILRFGGLCTKLIRVGQGPGMEVFYRVFCGFGFEPSFIDYPAFVSQLRQHQLNAAAFSFFYDSYKRRFSWSLLLSISILSNKIPFTIKIYYFKICSDNYLNCIHFQFFLNFWVNSRGF